MTKNPFLEASVILRDDVTVKIVVPSQVDDSDTAKLGMVAAGTVFCDLTRQCGFDRDDAIKQIETLFALDLPPSFRVSK